MPEITNSFSAGQSVEGNKLSPQVVSHAWGAVNDAQAVVKAREALELGLVITLVARGMPWQQAAQLVATQTPDAH